MLLCASVNETKTTKTEGNDLKVKKKYDEENEDNKIQRCRIKTVFVMLFEIQIIMSILR